MTGTSKSSKYGRDESKNENKKKSDIKKSTSVTVVSSGTAPKPRMTWDNEKVGWYRRNIVKYNFDLAPCM